MEVLKNFYNEISGFDLIYIFFTVLSLIKCSRKGFVLSLLAAFKWLLAYVVTLVIFPRAKPYVKDIIDNEYVLDVVLGVSIFILVIFNRCSSKLYCSIFYFRNNRITWYSFRHDDYNYCCYYYCFWFFNFSFF